MIQTEQPQQTSTGITDILGVNSTTLNPKKHKSPYWRPDKPINVQKTKRVEDVCVWTMEHRMLSFQQMVRLLNRSEPTVKFFLRRMYQGRYLNRVELPMVGNGRNPVIYKLDEKGVDLLEELGYKVAIPSQGFKIPHTLGLADIRIAITQAIEAMGWKLGKWKSEYDFDRDYHKVTLPGHKRTTSLKPDGFFVVEQPNKKISAFFLEFDRGSEGNKTTFMTKVKCYIQFHKSEQFTKEYGHKGFRVLTVVEDLAGRRLKNLTDEISKIDDIKHRFWLTHLNDINSNNPLNMPSWNIAGDQSNAQLFEA